MHPYVQKILHYAGSDFITKALYLLLLPLFTHYLSPQHYAVYANITIFMAFAGLLYVLGLQQALFSFFYQQKSPTHYRRVIITVISAVAATGAVLSVLIALYSQQISHLITRSGAYGHLIQITALIIFCDALYGIIRSLLNIMECSRSYGLLGILKNGLFVAVVGWYGIAGTLDVDQMFSALLAASVVSFVVAGVVMARQVAGLQAQKVGWSTSLFLKMAGFGLVMIPGTLAMMALRMSDRYMITWLAPRGMHDAGVYAISYRMGSFVAFLNGIVSLTYFPYAMKIAQQPHAKRSYKRVMHYYLLAGSIVAAAVMLFTPELFQLFIDSAYHAAIPIVFCGVISNFLNGIFNIINLSFYITKRAGNIAGAVILGAVVNIVLNFVLIPRWGIMGASVASVVAYLGIVVLNFNIAEKQLPVGYSPLYIAASLVLVCGVAVVNIFLPHTLLYTALKLALVIIPTVMLLWRYRSLKQIITHIQENIHGSDLSTE